MDGYRWFLFFHSRSCVCYNCTTGAFIGASSGWVPKSSSTAIHHSSKNLQNELLLLTYRCTDPSGEIRGITLSRCSIVYGSIVQRLCSVLHNLITIWARQWIIFIPICHFTETVNDHVRSGSSLFAHPCTFKVNTTIAETSVFCYIFSAIYI